VHAAIVSPAEIAPEPEGSPILTNAGNHIPPGKAREKAGRSGRTVAAVGYRQADRMTRDHDLEVRTDQ
jgi:hypothetical protein